MAHRVSPAGCPTLTPPLEPPPCFEVWARAAKSQKPSTTTYKRELIYPPVRIKCYDAIISLSVPGRLFMRSITWLLVAGLTLPASVLAQSTFGTILGTVTDTSGAIVPGVKITVTQDAQNRSREVTADSQGNDDALNLNPGPYTVSAAAAGFKTFRKSGLTLDARQTLRVDVTLEVGQLNEQVTVESTAAVINTETQTVAATFD